MASKLNKLSISGFKSIREMQDLELNNLNVLIGGNGAGKSNFVEIFRLLKAMVDQGLGEYILSRGGADDYLFNGPKVTESVKAHFCFGPNEYRFELTPTADEKFLIKSEEQKYELGSWKLISNSNFESKLSDVKDHAGIRSRYGVGHYVHEAVSSWTVYHFHDTSATSPVRRSEILQDCHRLRPNGANIAPLLLFIRQHDGLCYDEIVNTIKLVTPFFEDFLLHPIQKGEKETVNLTWRQRGSDYPMQPYHFSDGTIRFIGLATALLQPNPPPTILIDEPELGLHPYAIEVLAELVKSASTRSQVIISTQSPALVDHFDPEDILTVNRENGASMFNRLDTEGLDAWLNEYSLGDLWRKNVVSGGPVSE